MTGSGARVASVISWAKAQGVKLFMGEMATAGKTDICKREYRDLLARMEGSGVFVGWTAWGGGTWWIPTYPFRTLTTAWPSGTARTAHLNLLVERVGK